MPKTAAIAAPPQPTHPGSPVASSPGFGFPLFLRFPLKVSRFKRSVVSRFLPGAFTLMELMVSVTILVFIILSVGLIFSGASKSVGDSQAIMEMLSNVRAVQQLIGEVMSTAWTKTPSW